MQSTFCCALNLFLQLSKNPTEEQLIKNRIPTEVRKAVMTYIYSDMYRLTFMKDKAPEYA